MRSCVTVACYTPMKPPTIYIKINIHIYMETEAHKNADQKQLSGKPAQHIHTEEFLSADQVH